MVCTLMTELLWTHVLSLLSLFTSHGPDFGLHLNCQNVSCFDLRVSPPFLNSLLHVTGLELLGSPLWGDKNFFYKFLSSRLALLDDPQAELHLLCSCLSNCKIIH